MTRWVFNNL